MIPTSRFVEAIELEIMHNVLGMIRALSEQPDFQIRILDCLLTAEVTKRRSPQVIGR